MMKIQEKHKQTRNVREVHEEIKGKGIETKTDLWMKRMKEEKDRKERKKGWNSRKEQRRKSY
jgi:hypothetical protein